MQMKLWTAARAGGMHTCMDMLYSAGCESIINLVKISNNKDLCCNGHTCTSVSQISTPQHCAQRNAKDYIIPHDWLVGDLLNPTQQDGISHLSMVQARIHRHQNLHQQDSISHLEP